LFEIVSVASLDYECSDLEIAGAVDGHPHASLRT
jgi:hypothetical protein